MMTLLFPSTPKAGRRHWIFGHLPYQNQHYDYSFVGVIVTTIDLDIGVLLFSAI